MKGHCFSGEPGKPDVFDWGDDFAELKWKAPEDDGGAEVQEYRVEVRNRYCVHACVKSKPDK